MVRVFSNFKNIEEFEYHVMIFQKLFSIDRQLTLNELFTGGIKNISNNEDKKTLTV